MKEVGKDFLTEPEAAKLLTISLSALRAWRRAGEGPPHFRVGKRLVRYRAGDVRDWLLSNRVDFGETARGPEAA